MANQFARFHLFRFANQHQEGGLECILGIRVIGQYAPTDAKHRGSMPSNQFGECGFAAIGYKSFELLTI
jgi:hypothetical protein